MEMTQAQPQKGGAPGRMLFVQGQGVLEHRRGYRRGRARVGREQRRLALGREGLAQAADRAGGELQALGNDGGNTALLPEGQDSLTVDDREGSRHGNSTTTTLDVKRASRKSTPSP
jgi:hypothetical protein